MQIWLDLLLAVYYYYLLVAAMDGILWPWSPYPASSVQRSVALETADYGYVLEIGRVVMNDTCERLMMSQDIQEFYLGAKEDGARGERRWKKKKTWR